jgi:selenocysteine-specific elongation factor
METVAEIVLTGIKQIAPGEQLSVRVKLPEAALLLPGDRFILRQFSPLVTIGGGVVLDAAPIPRMTGQTEFARILASGSAEAILRARIARRDHNGIAVSRLIAETGWTKNFIETQLASALKEGRVLRTEDLLIHASALDVLRIRLVSAVEDFHKRNPLVAGIAKEQLRDQVSASAEVFDAALAILIPEKKIQVLGDLVRLPGHGVVMKDEEAESKKKIESAFMTAGLNVPALHEVIAGLKIDKVRAQKIVTLLLRDKVLIKISDELVFHRSALEELRRKVAAYKVKSLSIDVGQFKEMTGVSRKYAIPLLEFLDRERVTKRIGDARQIL